MKIRLALFLSDTVYAENLEQHFRKYFSNKVELYIYSNKDSFKNNIVDNRINMLLLDEGTSDVVSFVNESVQVAFLVAGLTGEFPNEIQKYQKAENIYKALLGLYADKQGSNRVYGNQLHNIPIYVFQSVNGGAGATTIALACARNLALRQKKVLYLNFEELESTYLYMDDSDNSSSMDNVLFALKSKRGNLAMKLESAVRTSKDSINYFYPCKNSYDMKEITVEDIETFLNVLMSLKQYDIIIVDQRLSIDKVELHVMKMADKLLWVSDGTEISLCKYRRAETMVLAEDKKNESDIYEKINLIYNGFSNKNGKEICNAVNVIGGFPRYEGAGFKEIVDILSKSALFYKFDV